MFTSMDSSACSHVIYFSINRDFLSPIAETLVRFSHACCERAHVRYVDRFLADRSVVDVDRRDESLLYVVPFDSRIAQCRRQDAGKEMAEKRESSRAGTRRTSWPSNGNSGRPYPFDYQRRRERRRPFILIITPSTRCANSKNLIPRGEVSNFFADTIPPKTGSLYNPATIGRFPFQLDRDYISFMKKNCIPLGGRGGKRSGINIIIKTCIHTTETPHYNINKSLSR